MKRIPHITKLLIFLLPIVLLNGCKESGTDSDSKSDNNFEYDGKTYALEAGVIFDYGVESEGFRNYDFILTEKVEDFDELNESEEEELNSDYFVYFWLESLGESSFTGGTFNFDDSEEAETSHLYSSELTFLSGNEEEYFEAISGKVNVSIDGDTYTLDFDITLDNGKKMVGKFSYDFQIFDESSLEKSATSDSEKKSWRSF